MFLGKVSSSTPDHELLLRTHRGDDRAARELWSRFGPSLVALASAMLRGSGRAGGEDIVQAVFCRVLGLTRAELRAVRDVRAWFAAMVRNACINERRARRREVDRLARLRAAGGRADTSPRPDAALLDRLAQLEDDLAEIVMLKHAAGLTFDQVAEVLGVSRGTLSSRYQRAIEQLRAAEEREERGSDVVKTGAP